MKGGSPSPKSQKKPKKELPSQPNRLEMVRDILRVSNKTVAQLAELVGDTPKRVKSSVGNLAMKGLIVPVGSEIGMNGQLTSVWGWAGKQPEVLVDRCPVARLESHIKQLKKETVRDINAVLAKGPQTPFGWLLEAAEKRPAYVEE